MIKCFNVVVNNGVILLPIDYVKHILTMLSYTLIRNISQVMLKHTLYRKQLRNEFTVSHVVVDRCLILTLNRIIYIGPKYY